MAKFTQPEDSKSYDTPRLWPITQKVRIHCNARLLNAGLIFGDTPGFNDRDPNVVANTLAYLDKSAIVFVFTQAPRGSSGIDREGILRACLIFKVKKTIYALCNKIDQVELREAVDIEEVQDENRAMQQRIRTASYFAFFILLCLQLAIVWAQKELRIFAFDLLSHALAYAVRGCGVGQTISIASFYISVDHLKA